MKHLHARLAQSHAHLRRGRVWCRRCSATQNVDPAHCLQHGWPKCCDRTMTIDSPEKQRALARRPWAPAVAGAEAEMA